MLHLSELKFVQNVLKKNNIQSLLVNPYDKIDNRIDYGIRTIFGSKAEKDLTFEELLSPLKKNIIYKLTDNFRCSYIFMLLSNEDRNSLFCIGPFLNKIIEHENLLEWAEKYSLNQEYIRQLEIFYQSLPILPDDSVIYSIIDSFAETVYGTGGQFTSLEIGNDFSVETPDFTLKNDFPDISDSEFNIQIMEARYAFENEIMNAVSQGLEQKAESILNTLGKSALERRLPDPVRNTKNYCIIMNTLLRKAAENGGVHPVYLDSTSSNFAKRIESLTSLYAVQCLMVEMFKTYCRLVNKHSLKDYSLPVQKTIISIDSDLTADLTLSTLAEKQNISSGYLSALFKKETGKTLTDFVNEKRIDYAKKLLKNSNLQIQTIAQYCGIPDFQYFSKIFKRYVGTTPKNFRKG